MDNKTPIFVSAQEAANTSNISKVTILKYVEKGRIRAVYDQIRNAYLIDLKSLMAFNESRYIEIKKRR